MRSIKCASCGRVFDTNERNKYCGSVECLRYRDRTYAKPNTRAQLDHRKQVWHELHPRRLKSCLACGREFVVRITNAQQYCSAVCGRKTWVERARVKRKILRKQFKADWGYLGSGRHDYVSIGVIERAAEAILIKKGLRDLVYISKLYRMFPFDWIGWVEDRLVLIDVTANVAHLTTRKSLLISALKAEGFILFISPKLNRYAFVPIQGARHVQLERNLKFIEEFVSGGE